jgi:hypothetical protein
VKVIFTSNCAEDLLQLDQQLLGLLSPPLLNKLVFLPATHPSDPASFLIFVCSSNMSAISSGGDKSRNRQIRRKDFRRKEAQRIQANTGIFTESGVRLTNDIFRGIVRFRLEEWRNTGGAACRARVCRGGPVETKKGVRGGRRRWGGGLKGDSPGVLNACSATTPNTSCSRHCIVGGLGDGIAAASKAAAR